jgi:lipopolysaccharide/colanic/teichoic acid biosynthesis glycosyltransferase
VRRGGRVVSEIHPSLAGIGGAVKRGMDILLSVAGMILLAPVLGVFAWLICRQSPGLATYSQTRLGLSGRPFVLRKLRTMRVDAETDGPVWAVEDDPRCTRIGGILRRTGIDELLQLWNVLRGEMSLVGPRPERPEFHAGFRSALPEFDRRLSVRAGITGLAQVRGWRGDTSIEERLRSDLEYIDNWSIRQDLAIMLRTGLQFMFGAFEGVTGMAVRRPRSWTRATTANCAPPSPIRTIEPL